MSDRQELVLLLREVMRWEKRSRKLPAYVRITEIDWDDLADILNRAHVAISTDSRSRPRQRPQKPISLRERRKNFRRTYGREHIEPIPE